MSINFRAIVGQAGSGEDFIDSKTLIAFAAGAACVLLWLLGKKLRFSASAQSPPLQPTQPHAAAGTNQDLDPQLLSVLVAAATAVLGSPVVVHRITFLNQDTVSGWAEAGRMSLHLSHNFRRDSQ